MSGEPSTLLTNYISNRTERKRIKISLILTTCIVAISLILVFTWLQNIYPLHTRKFRFIATRYGSIAQFGVYFAVAIFPLLWYVKKQPFKFKPLIGYLAKWARQWHVPVAIFTIGLVLIHGILVISNGFRLDFRYLSGILAFLVLAIIPITGLLRYKRLDKKWHMVLGLLFFVLFFIHANL